MAKKCFLCDNGVFTHGYCRNHAYIYYAEKKSNQSLTFSTKDLRGTSLKTQEGNDIIAKHKKQRIHYIGKRCQICGRYSEVDWAHIIPKSYSQLLRNRVDNGILACRSCHDIFDQNFTIIPVSKLLELHPWRFKAILGRMKSLDELYYNRFVSRNNLFLKHGITGPVHYRFC